MAAHRIKRWYLDLSAYDYSWKYRYGKNMCHADAMSRLPLNDPERDEVPLPTEVVFLLQTLDYSPISSEQIRIMTRRYPVLGKILDYVTTGSWHTNCFNTNLYYMPSINTRHPRPHTTLHAPTPPSTYHPNHLARIAVDYVDLFDLTGNILPSGTLCQLSTPPWGEGE